MPGNFFSHKSIFIQFKVLFSMKNKPFLLFEVKISFLLCRQTCLVIFDRISDVVNFTLLGTVYFSIYMKYS